MGFFDNFIKQIDQGLKAVESGDLEKKLDSFANQIEMRSVQADEVLQKAVEKPSQLLKTVEAKTVAVERKAQDVIKPLRHKIDISD